VVPRIEQLGNHLSHFSRVKLERTPSSTNVEARTAGPAKATKLAKSRSAMDLDGHTAGALHRRLKRDKDKSQRKEIEMERTNSRGSGSMSRISAVTASGAGRVALAASFEEPNS